MADFSDPVVSVPLATVGTLVVRELVARFWRTRDRLEERVEGVAVDHKEKLEALPEKEATVRERLAALEEWCRLAEPRVFGEKKP